MSCATGSSPLARGLPGGGGPARPGARIIPARAGFTQRITPPISICRDHPRSRGVYGDLVDRLRAAGGSSPLARGLRADAQDPGDVPGIIPARAGFTRAGCAGARRCEDHPRSRGVYAGEFYPCAPDVGSSPLARGLLVIGGRHPVLGRIIPARAGFTLEMWGDRPAICGSSPLARGLRGCLETGADRCGIIPARAGFTQASDPR